MAEEQPQLEWRAPDEKLFWFQDAMHLPHALTPLDATMVQPAFTEGASRAIARLSMPIEGLRAEVVNGYTYLCPVVVQGSPDELEARFGEMQRLTGELSLTVLKDWRQTFEPEVLAHCDAILSFDYDAASTPEIASFVAGCHGRMIEFWDIHMQVNIPPMNAVFGMEEMLGSILGEDAASQSRLLQGFDNKSVAFGRALWRLSRWIREDAALAEAILEATARDSTIVVAEQSLAGEFRQRWQEFLDIYGWRGNRFMEIASPSWLEDQSTVLTQLKGFLSKPDNQDPYETHRRQAEERDRLVAEMESSLPPEALPPFRGLLEIAQQYIPIAEDHNFTIDQKSFMVVRSAVRNLGARLASEGIQQAADDVFYLTLEEIRSLAENGSKADFKDAVTERRLAQQRQERATPPPTLGTAPPADLPPDPLVTKFFGLGRSPERAGRIIKGMACSTGVMTGTAKVLHSLDEADKLQQGEILVCKTTMPPWTPLFGVAGAVVTDAGGPLSHCAIVAREYGIPCVAGTQIATHDIQDGMRLKVDGGAGTVEILA